VELARYLDCLRADGTALATAAARAPEAPILSCPDWDMMGLLAHVGNVHRWAETLVRTRSPVYVKYTTPTLDSPDAVLAWYDEGLAALLATLSATDPYTAVWNWFDGGPAPAWFWSRRMAHETAIHRWDAESGATASDATDPGPVAADLAVDGIDEFLGFVESWLARQPVAGLEGSLHLHATDTDGEWALDLWPDRLEYRREHTKADAAVRGPVSDLLLWMLNRLPADSPTLQVFGDATILDRWRQLQF
jgi:uncharacterized protein (TIGR03083 family)